MQARNAFLAAACVALNLSLAKVAALFSLPVYLDSIGTIIGAALLPWPIAVAVGAATSLLGAVVVHPYFAAYVGTQVSIASVAALLNRLGMFRKLHTALAAGIGIAAVAVVVSAPVTVVLFGGVTLSGTTAINAVLLASGKTLWQSVMAGSAVIEAIDKPAAALLSWMVLNRLGGSLEARPQEEAR